MTDREKLYKLLNGKILGIELEDSDKIYTSEKVGELTDYLITHGITVKKENPVVSRDSISAAFLHHITALTDGMTHYERLENDIKICSGYSLEELRDMFAAGFTLIKTEDSNSIKK